MIWRISFLNASENSCYTMPVIMTANQEGRPETRMLINEIGTDVLSLKGKKILIFGGNAAHIKLVETAKRMCVHTIVTDYLEPESSPAKKIADEYWMISYGDTDTLVQRCKDCHVDGVLVFSHESSQIPYYHLCQRMGFPCYANLEQFEILTNKRLFKECCQANGVSVIPEYEPVAAMEGNAEFPVMVKPVDRCGSNGMTLCNNAAELASAIKAARDESIRGEIIIEKYLANRNSFQVTYFFVDGTPYLIRTADGYKGLPEENLDRVALCSVSPSVYTEEFLRTTHENFVRMLKKTGVQNGPVMAQGFYDDGVFRFYDPGRRFPGTDFEIVYRDLYNIDLMQMMIVFALTGKMPVIPENMSNDNVYLKGKKAVVLFPTIRTGTIGKIRGYDELKSDGKIRNVRQKHVEGAVIRQENTVSQRIFEIDFIANSNQDVKDIIKEIQGKINVTDTQGKSMVDHIFDAERIK